MENINKIIEEQKMRAIIESDHPNSYQYIVKFEDGSEIRCESIEEAIKIKKSK